MLCAASARFAEPPLQPTALLWLRRMSAGNEKAATPVDDAFLSLAADLLEAEIRRYSVGSDGDVARMDADDVPVGTQEECCSDGEGSCAQLQAMVRIGACLITIIVVSLAEGSPQVRGRRPITSFFSPLRLFSGQLRGVDVLRRLREGLRFVPLAEVGEQVDGFLRLSRLCKGARGVLVLASGAARA